VKGCRPGHRTILRCMVIALGFATLTTLAASAAPSQAGGASRVIRFSGHNVKGIRHFRVAVPSTMSWTNSGSFFQVSNHGGISEDGPVTSQAHRGTTYLGPGRYEQLRVRALGDWTITIRPGIEEVVTPIRFSGSGAQELPPFRLRSGKTIYWRNSGSRFQIYPSCRSGTNGVISSPGHRGRTHLPAGRYQLYVNAAPPEEQTGTWSIVIR
jgi:hypothetical protein